jgi:hypothetical protein
MPTLLAIGTDPRWLEAVSDAAEAAGLDVQRCTSLLDAVEKVGPGLPLPSLVVLDADCWTQRADPALRVLRSRLRVRFVVAFGPASEGVARALPWDALVSKTETSIALRREVDSRR